MALIQCAECGNGVSTQAAACPKCGARVKPKAQVVPWVAAGLVGAFALAVVVSLTPKDESEKGRDRAQLQVCLREMNDTLRSPGYREATRSACARMRDEFRAKYRHEP